MLPSTRYIEDFIEKEKDLLKEKDLAQLHSAKITPENIMLLNEKLYEWVEKFPKELENGFKLKENMHKAIEYLNNH